MSQRFELTVPSAHLKQFAAAVQSLTFAGRELIFEVVPPGASQASRSTEGVLILRALNDAHSVFAAVTFDRAFFERARFPDAHSGTQPFCFTCKINAKSLAPMLRKATAQRHAGAGGAGGGDRSLGGGCGDRRRANGSGVLRLVISNKPAGGGGAAGGGGGSHPDVHDAGGGGFQPMLVFEVSCGRVAAAR